MRWLSFMEFILWSMLMNEYDAVFASMFSHCLGRLCQTQLLGGRGRRESDSQVAWHRVPSVLRSRDACLGMLWTDTSSSSPLS